MEIPGFTCMVTLVILFSEACHGASWMEFEDAEYWIEDDLQRKESSWYEAHRFCLDNDADLVSINNASEQAWIQDKVYAMNLFKGVWIGLNNMTTKWNWTDGTELDFEAWDTSYPKYSSIFPATSLCVYSKYSKTGDTWQNGNCGFKKSFVCKRDVNETARPDVNPTSPTLVAGYCPDPEDYIDAGNNKCYKLITNAPANFTMAQLRCAQEPGKNPGLATINSEHERDVVTSLMNQIDVGQYWIGLYYTSSSWVWVDSSPATLTNWGPRQPDNTAYVYIKSYASRFDGGKWFTASYSSYTAAGFVCQTFKDPSNVTLTSPSPTPSSCPEDYISYWDGCYKLVSSPDTWPNAQHKCENEGGNLVSIHSSVEQSAIINFAGSSGDFWIGLNDLQIKGDYEWSDNWIILYSHWGPGQPSPLVAGGCVRMGMSDEAWFGDDDCNKTLPYMCKIVKQGVVPYTPPTPTNGTCPFNWVEWGGHCYYFSTDRVPWFRAMGNCVQAYPDAHLTTIHSFAENKFIYDHFNSSGSSRSTLDNWWIGMFMNRQSKTYEWLSNEPMSFDLWDLGQPTYGSTNRGCVYVNSNPDKNGRWGVQLCSTNHHYVCKMSKFPEPTMPAPVAGDCPGDDWIAYGERCLLFKPDGFATYEGAAKDCKVQGGDRATLVTLDDELMGKFVLKHMMDSARLPGSRPYWLGLARDNTTQSLPTPGNLAKGKSAVASSVDFGRGPERAVDGIRLGSSTYYESQYQEGAWFYVDLGRIYQVGIIRITSCRCSYYRMRFDLGVSETEPQMSTDNSNGYTKCGTGNISEREKSSNFTCNMQGRYVVMQTKLPGSGRDYIVLGEFEVFARAVSGDTTYKWMDTGEQPRYTNWADGEPKYVQHCVKADTQDNGRWSENNCGDTMGYGCQVRKVDKMITTPAPGNGTCPLGWENWGSHCYLFSTNGADWHGAMGNCTKDQPTASLASIHSYSENQYISEQFKKMTSSVTYNWWIGMFQTRTDYKLEWYDAETIDFEYWESGKPSKKGQENVCVYMNSNPSKSAKWSDGYCTNYNYYVCKMEKLSLPTVPPPVEGDCPSDKWVGYGPRCFLFQPDKYASYEAAENACLISSGGNKTRTTLLTLDDEDMEAYVIQSMMTISRLPTLRPFWLGLKNKIKPGDQRFRWVDTWAEPQFTNWENSRPSATNDSLCVQISLDYRGDWTPVPCSRSLGYICQYWKIPVTKVTDPTTTTEPKTTAEAQTTNFHETSSALIVDYTTPSVPTTPTTYPAQPTTEGTTSPTSGPVVVAKSPNSLHISKVIAIGVGCLVFGAIVAAVACFIYSRTKKPRFEGEYNEFNGFAASNPTYETSA